MSIAVTTTIETSFLRSDDLIKTMLVELINNLKITSTAGTPRQRMS
jgi:hypothetical protein